jgi:hypothetical protein
VWSVHSDHANLFLVPLDDEHRWYRYRALFADLLRAWLHEMQPRQVPVFHGDRTSVRIGHPANPPIPQLADATEGLLRYDEIWQR